MKVKTPSGIWLVAIPFGSYVPAKNYEHACRIERETEESMMVGLWVGGILGGAWLFGIFYSTMIAC